MKVFVGLALLAATATIVRGAQVAATWDGATGAWTDSAHWGLAPSLYPDNNAAPDTTYAASIAAGSVTLDGLSPTVDQLTLTGGKLAGTGTLTVSGAFTWTGANIAVASMLARGTVTLSPASGTLPAYTPSMIGTAFTLDSGATFNLSLTGTTQTFNFQQNATFTNNGTFNSLTNATFTGYPNGLLNHQPDGRFVNNGTLTIQNGLAISSTITFDNAGLIQVLKGNFLPGALGADSPSSSVIIGAQARLLDIGKPFTTGTLSNAGTMTFNYNGPATTTLGGAGLHLSNAGTLSVEGGLVIIGDAAVTPSHTTVSLPTASTFINTGTLQALGSAVHLFAAQDPATTGAFIVDAQGTLDFAADYDFSHAGGPTLSGTGALIIDPGMTLTLPADSAFAGNVEVDGTLVIAPPLNPNAAPGDLLRFTVVSQAAPEPAAAAMMILGAGALLLRRPRRLTLPPAPAAAR